MSTTRLVSRTHIVASLPSSEGSGAGLWSREAEPPITRPSAFIAAAVVESRALAQEPSDIEGGKPPPQWPFFFVGSIVAHFFDCM